MTARMLAWLSAAVVTIVAVCAGLTTTLFYRSSPALACQPAITTPGNTATASSHASPTSPATQVTPGALGTLETQVTAGHWDTEQLRNAATIITVGAARRVPPRGWVIAVATAIQESDLRNLGDLGSHNDHDSLGLFQQRPSQGWGTPEQIMDPSYAAAKFYEKLVQIPLWETLPLTVAAQAVQTSAFPNAYAKHEPDAQQLVASIASASATAGFDGNCVSPAGWTHPLPGYKVTSDYRTPDRPAHHGVDLSAPKGTPIRAAAAGEVITVLCNLGGQTFSAAYRPSPCDADGSPTTSGCGWYLEIKSGEFIHRYCHQLVRPAVNPGQTVAAGQVIGVVGTSGNSSGPHLHLEIHKVTLGQRQDAGPENAVPPVDHFWSVGIDLNS